MAQGKQEKEGDEAGAVAEQNDAEGSQEGAAGSLDAHATGEVAAAPGKSGEKGKGGVPREQRGQGYHCLGYWADVCTAWCGVESCAVG